MQLREGGLAFAARNDPAGVARHFIEYWMGPQAWITMPERRQAAILASLKRLEPDWQGTLLPHTSLDDYRGLNVPALMLRAREPETLSLAAARGLSPHGVDGVRIRIGVGVAGKVVGQMAVSLLVLALYIGIGVLMLSSFAMLGLLDPWLTVAAFVTALASYYSVRRVSNAPLLGKIAEIAIVIV